MSVKNSVVAVVFALGAFSAAFAQSSGSPTFDQTGASGTPAINTGTGGNNGTALNTGGSGGSGGGSGGGTGGGSVSRWMGSSGPGDGGTGSSFGIAPPRGKTDGGMGGELGTR